MTGASAAARAIFAAARGDAEVQSLQELHRTRRSASHRRDDRRRGARAGASGRGPLRPPPLRGDPEPRLRRLPDLLGARSDGPGAGRGPVLHARRGLGLGRRGGSPLPGARLLRRRRRAARRSACGSTSSSRRSAPAPRGSPGSSRARGSGSTARSAGRSRRPGERGRGRRRSDPGRRRDRGRAAGDLAPAAPRRRDPGAGPARLPRPGQLRRTRISSTARRSGSRARTGTPATAAT